MEPDTFEWELGPNADAHLSYIDENPFRNNDIEFDDVQEKKRQALQSQIQNWIFIHGAFARSCQQLKVTQNVYFISCIYDILIKRTWKPWDVDILASEETCRILLPFLFHETEEVRFDIMQIFLFFTSFGNHEIRLCNMLRAGILTSFDHFVASKFARDVKSKKLILSIFNNIFTMGRNIRNQILLKTKIVLACLGPLRMTIVDIDAQFEDYCQVAIVTIGNIYLDGNLSKIYVTMCIDALQTLASQEFSANVFTNALKMIVALYSNSLQFFCLNPILQRCITLIPQYATNPNIMQTICSFLTLLPQDEYDIFKHHPDFNLPSYILAFLESQQYNHDLSQKVACILSRFIRVSPTHAAPLLDVLAQCVA